jgi:hypothetical protein
MKELEVYTIYDHPSDYPNHFVVRKWLIRGDKPIPTDWIRASKSLKVVRKYIPFDRVRIERSIEDNRYILESWI